MSREKVLASILKDVKKDYDYILIDCMPSLGMVTINALTAADSVIIPVQAQYLPTKGMTQLLKSINMVRTHTNERLNVAGIVMTLVDSRTNLAKEVINTIRTNYGLINPITGSKSTLIGKKCGDCAIGDNDKCPNPIHHSSDNACESFVSKEILTQEMIDIFPTQGRATYLKYGKAGKSQFKRAKHESE